MLSSESSFTWLCASPENECLSLLYSSRTRVTFPVKLHVKELYVCVSWHSYVHSSIAYISETIYPLQKKRRVSYIVGQIDIHSVLNGY